MGHEFTYEIEEHIATLKESGYVTVELNRVSYNGAPAKYDIRGWRRYDGEEQILKGITLSSDEARILKDALNGREDL